MVRCTGSDMRARCMLTDRPAEISPRKNDREHIFSCEPSITHTFPSDGMCYLHACARTCVFVRARVDNITYEYDRANWPGRHAPRVGPCSPRNVSDYGRPAAVSTRLRIPLSSRRQDSRVAATLLVPDRKHVNRVARTRGGIRAYEVPLHLFSAFQIHRTAAPRAVENGKKG